MKKRWWIAIVAVIPLTAAIAVSGLGARDPGRRGTMVPVVAEVAPPRAVSVREERGVVAGAASTASTASSVVDGVVVEGTVRDLFGNVVDGATVSAAGASAITDGAGRFVLRVAAGPHVVRAVVDGHAPAERELTAPATDVALVLVPEAELRGVVVERGSRAPVAGVEVVARGLTRAGLGLPPIARAVALTDGAGRFAFTGLPPGRYDVAASTALWAGRLAEPVVVEAARPVDELLVELAPRTPAAEDEVAAGLHIRGRALDAQGRPLAGVVIAVEPDGDDARTDDDGVFEANGLAPGLHALTVMSDDRRPRSDAVAVVLDDGVVPPDVVLVARAEASLRGRIVDGPRGVALTAFAQGEDGAVAQTRVHDDGSFGFDDLTPGPQRVTVCDPWAGELAATHAHASAAGATVTLRAPRFDVTIGGRVVDAAGHAPAAAVVTAETEPDGDSPCVPEESARTAVPTDDQGRFRLPALPARAYRVRATALDGDRGVADALPGANPVIHLGPDVDDPDSPPPLLDRR